MKFLKTYSYDMLKMFLNQFGTSIFGLALALAAAKAQNVILRNVTSVCAILFYLFLLYTMTWDIGFRERVSVLQEKTKRNPFRGVIISLGANALNFIFAICITLGCFLPSIDFFSSLGAIATFGGLLLEGMFTGLLANDFMGNALNSYWWVWFIIPIPSTLICGIAYNMGLHDFKLTALIFGKKGTPSSKK